MCNAKLGASSWIVYFFQTYIYGHSGHYSLVYQQILVCWLITILQILELASSISKLAVYLLLPDDDFLFKSKCYSSWKSGPYQTNSYSPDYFNFENHVENDFAFQSSRCLFVILPSFFAFINCFSLHFLNEAAMHVQGVHKRHEYITYVRCVLSATQYISHIFSAWCLTYSH